MTYCISTRIVTWLRIPSGCTGDQIRATLENAIKNLTVYAGEGVCPTGQPCRPYCLLANANYCDDQPADLGYLLPPTTTGALFAGGGGTQTNAKGLDCGNGYFYSTSNPQDPSGCTTTDLGDGLLTAADEFGVSQRQGSLWVVVLLTDGSANSGPVVNGNSVTCPQSEWISSSTQTFCRDSSTNTRHCLPGVNYARCITEGNGLPVIPDNPTGIHV